MLILISFNYSMLIFAPVTFLWAHKLSEEVYSRVLKEKFSDMCMQKRTPPVQVLLSQIKFRGEMREQGRRGGRRGRQVLFKKGKNITQPSGEVYIQHLF